MVLRPGYNSWKSTADEGVVAAAALEIVDAVAANEIVVAAGADQRYRLTTGPAARQPWLLGARLVPVMPFDRSMAPPTPSKLIEPHGADAVSVTPVVVKEAKLAML